MLIGKASFPPNLVSIRLNTEFLQELHSNNLLLITHLHPPLSPFLYLLQADLHTLEEQKDMDREEWALRALFLSFSRAIYVLVDFTQRKKNSWRK